MFYKYWFRRMFGKKNTQFFYWDVIIDNRKYKQSPGAKYLDFWQIKQWRFSRINSLCSLYYSLQIAWSWNTNATRKYETVKCKFIVHEGHDVFVAVWRNTRMHWPGLTFFNIHSPIFPIISLFFDACSSNKCPHISTHLFIICYKILNLV